MDEYGARRGRGREDGWERMERTERGDGSASEVERTGGGLLAAVAAGLDGDERHAWTRSELGDVEAEAGRMRGRKPGRHTPSSGGPGVVRFRSSYKAAAPFLAPPHSPVYPATPRTNELRSRRPRQFIQRQPHRPGSNRSRRSPGSSSPLPPLAK